MTRIARHNFEASGPPASECYEATELGAPFKVYLANGVTSVPDKQTGKVKTEITDLPGLIAAVVRSRVLHPRRLSGDELRFIRRSLCLKSNSLAKVAEMTPENYCRCESGQKAMAGPMEKVYRSTVFLLTFAKDKSIQDADEPIDDLSPEDGKKVLEGLRKLFLKMKISPVFDARETLEFTFTRGCIDDDAPCGDDEWTNETLIAA